VHSGRNKKKTNTLKRVLIGYYDVAISNVTINVRIRYGNSAHLGYGCRQKVAAKPLHIVIIYSLEELVIALIQW